MKTKTKTRLGNLTLPTTLSLLTLASFASIYINISPAHAKSSSSANASVTVSDTIRLTLTGGDLVINNLTPGTSADSNIITATVTSNSPYGFHLSATTGTKNGTTSLVNTADSNFVFTNLDSNKASLSNFSDNTWGYSYSTNNGTSWVSGDYGITQSGYNGLSLDNDDSGATGTTLFNSDTYTNSTAVKFKIGAKSSSTQAAGTYTGTVNFYAVVNPGTAQCNGSALCINFDGNGLTFNGEATNDASYISTPIVDERIEHSNSVYTEEGVYNRYATYGGNDVVTIKGATSLHIKVTYGVPDGENGPPSFLYIWEGNHPDYTNYNSNVALRQCGDVTADFYSNGSSGSQLTMECDILGDSVTFYDYSNYGVSTGYYATVSASVNAFSRQNIAGAYAVPEGSDASFLGWSSSRTTPGEGSVADVEYTNGSEVLYLMPGNNSETKKLYAVWKRPRSIANCSTMQEVDECPTTLPSERIYTLADARDGQEYRVAKLKDGKCWLLDNLALDLTDSIVLNGMNESNTHASNTTLNYLKGTTTRDPSTDPDGQYATAAVSNLDSGDSYSAPLVNMSNKDVIPSDSISQAGRYKVGGYYNFCAASAGSYCYGDGISVGTSSGNAAEDICPKGWRLPTGNTTGEYSALARAIYGSTGYTSDATTYANYRSALRLPLPGYFYNGGYAINRGNYGYWWSSTRDDNYSMYLLSVYSTYANPTYYDGRSSGRSVRCVLGS